MESNQILMNMASLFDRNPAYARLYAHLILNCQDQISEDRAAEIADSLKNSVSQTQDGPALVASLVRKGGLERTILVDGEAYAGSPAELQADESIPAEALIQYLVQATPEGVCAAEGYLQDASPAGLFATDPAHAQGYQIALHIAAQTDGATTAQLQDALIEEGIVKAGAAGAQELHASYFTSKLERYGALVWDRKRWRTTPDGLAAINA